MWFEVNKKNMIKISQVWRSNFRSAYGKMVNIKQGVGFEYNPLPPWRSWRSGVDPCVWWSGVLGRVFHSGYPWHGAGFLLHQKAACAGESHLRGPGRSSHAGFCISPLSFCWLPEVLSLSLYSLKTSWPLSLAMQTDLIKWFDPVSPFDDWGCGRRLA